MKRAAIKHRILPLLSVTPARDLPQGTRHSNPLNQGTLMKAELSFEVLLKRRALVRHLTETPADLVAVTKRPRTALSRAGARRKASCATPAARSIRHLPAFRRQFRAANVLTRGFRV